MPERLGNSSRTSPFLWSANWRQPGNVFVEYKGPKNILGSENTELPELLPCNGSCGNDRGRFARSVGELRVEQ